MQSFELARVLEGEKALRSEVARRKAAVDRHLSQAQACADSAAAAALQAEQTELHAQLQKHSNQVCADTDYCSAVLCHGLPWSDNPATTFLLD